MICIANSVNTIIINMKHLKLLVLISTVFIIGLGAAIAVYAQEIPSGAQGPSAEEISQFEKEFGAPPEAFPEPKIERPTFEQPGKAPEEIKQYVSDKELVEVYCAMTRWKSGAFLTAMEAVKKHVVPAVEKVRELGIEVSMPDVDALKADGLKRIEAICGTSTMDEAQRLSEEFSSWGQNQASASFDSLRTDIQTKTKAKGDELRQKIKAEIDPFVAEERTKIEAELRQYGEQLASQKQAELADSKTPPDVGAIQSEIQQQIMAQVEGKKSAMKEKIQAKVNSIMGGQKEKFEEIGKLFEGIDKKINDEIKAGEGQYDQYKKQAFDLRKNLVFKILDKNIEEGLKQLDAASADIEGARKENPSIKSVGEIKADISQDKQVLAAKLDAALEAGDENAFQVALNDFRVKWENYQRDMEKAASQSVGKACTVALAQFGQARTQIDSQAGKITGLKSRCAGSVTEECLKVNEFAPRLGTLESKFADIKTEMGLAEKMCQTPETADRKNLIALMKKIQSDSEDIKVYGKALEAEKSEAIADSAQKACAQVLPQLAAAENEIKKNGLTVLENNISKCKGKISEECNAVNNLTGDLNKLKRQISGFDANVQKAEDLCSKAASEEDFKTLSDTLNTLKSDGGVLRIAARDLQAKQSERMNEKALCRAAAPQFESVKQQIANGLAQMNTLKSDCAGKNDTRCNAINSNSGKFDALKNQAQTTLGKIADINSRCVNASADKLDQGLIDAMDSIKKDKDIIDKMVADLKAIEAEAGKSNGITIEAENETTSFIYPISQRPAPNTKEINISWRPAYFGNGVWYLAVGGEYLTYSFIAPQDGTYNVWVRDYVDNFQARGIRKTVVSFDGENYGTFPENSSFVPSNNKKGILAWHRVGDGVNLKAGQHTMKIMKEATTRGAAILDSFYLTTGNEVPPEK